MESLKRSQDPAVKEAHGRAEKEMLTFLAEQTEPISPEELFDHVNNIIHSWNLQLGSNQPTAQGSFWNLVDQGRISSNTPDRKVILVPPSPEE